MRILPVEDRDFPREIILVLSRRNINISCDNHIRRIRGKKKITLQRQGLKIKINIYKSILFEEVICR